MSKDELLITGVHRIGPTVERRQPLEEMIFAATQGALEDAGTSLAEIDGVFMAASDVHDGRAISTMTLTGSVGSFGKHEMRVCDDGLGALSLAAASLEAGVCTTAVVSAWAQVTLFDLAHAERLSTEPAFHRPLGMDGRVVGQLQRSFEGGRTTVAERGRAVGGDAAAALVLRRGDPTTGGARARVRGLGWSAGSYLTPRAQGTPVEEAAARALTDAVGLRSSDVDEALVCGMPDLDLGEPLRALGLTTVNTAYEDPDIASATGLMGAIHAVGLAGTRLVISRAGIGTARGYAAVVETLT